MKTLEKAALLVWILFALLLVEIDLGVEVRTPGWILTVGSIVAFTVYVFAPSDK